MVTLTLTSKEAIVLSAALQCYIFDRMTQVAEAADSGSEHGAELFEHHVADAEDLLKRITTEQTT